VLLEEVEVFRACIHLWRDRLWNDRLWNAHLWNDERGQDVAEYAVMLAVVLVIVVGTVRLIGSSANNVFSQVGSGLAGQ
jgi:Flp pilus assembly pilin Flp